MKRVVERVLATLDAHLETRPVHTCGWCQLRGPLATQDDVSRALADARADSVSWRWRWRVRP